jgi:glycosyltransferase involved in cell wall biosynthesis
MRHKVLFILHLPPPVHGSSVVGSQIKNSILVNDSYNCSFINLKTSSSLGNMGKIGFGTVFRYLIIFGKLIFQLSVNRPKLCYMAITSKGYAFYKDAFLAIVIKLFGVKIVYHFHNKGTSSRQDKVIDNLLYKMVFKNSSAILLSNYLYYDVEKYFSKNMVFTCNNGIPDFANLKVPDVTIIRNDVVEILFLSNLIISKGVYVLLEACKILREKNINFHCTFAGCKGDLSELEFFTTVERLDLTNYVNYIGEIFGDDKETTFKKADIFAFPTYYHFECFPLVILEAMQRGLPVVSTPEGAISDIIVEGKTGFIVPQKNPIILAEKLEILISNNHLREELGRNGRVRYENLYTLNQFENNFVSILSSLVNN